MRRWGSGEGVVQVELREDDAALAPAPSPDDDTGGPHAARVRRLRWVGLAVVAALLGTIVTATVIDARQAAARRVALAELGWVLPPMGGPLEEVWRASGGWVIAATDGVLVVQEVTGNAVRALDASTGAVLWERNNTNESCFPVYDYRSSAQGRYPASENLICAPASLYALDGLPEPGVTVSLVAIDVATGAELRTLVIDGGVLVQDAVDDDLLLTSLDAEAAIGVVRWDPRAGEVWSYRGESGVLPDGAPWGAGTDWGYELREDVLRLTDDLALDVGTGLAVPADASGPEPYLDGYVQVLPDGARAEWRWGDGSQGWATRGRVLNADGSLRFEIDGEPWTLGPTDGSVPDAILALGADGVAVALDPLSGGELWSAPGMTGTWPAYLLEGVLVVAGPGAVTALDARDGTVLWQVDSEWAANTMAPTDGDAVLVQVAEHPGFAIVAVDLRTGTEAWRMPGTGLASYWDLVPVGDRFVLLTDSEIIGFR
jgi:outer membrane protein assembly factor BamB